MGLENLIPRESYTVEQIQFFSTIFEREANKEIGL
jgi:hypothetical protein